MCDKKFQHRGEAELRIICDTTQKKSKMTQKTRSTIMIKASFGNKNMPRQ